jgi:hypothetical protein
LLCVHRAFPRLENTSEKAYGTLMT